MGKNIMAHEFQLTLTRKDTGENVTIEESFPADSWNSLIEYTEYVDDLINTKYAQDGMPAALNIKWEQNSRMQFISNLPDWDDVTVFLHKFRPIGLEKESTFFYKICSILTKELTHPYFRNIIDVQRDIYSGKRTQRAYSIQVDDVIVNSEKVLYDWLNSFEYHRDKEKRKFIDSLNEVFPLNASKVLFLGLLSDKMHAIYNIAILVRVVVGMQNSFESE